MPTYEVLFTIKYSPMAAVASAVCDAVITFSIVYYLRPARTGRASARQLYQEVEHGIRGDGTSLFPQCVGGGGHVLHTGQQWSGTVSNCCSRCVTEQDICELDAQRTQCTQDDTGRTRSIGPAYDRDPNYPDYPVISTSGRARTLSVFNFLRPTIKIINYHAKRAETERDVFQLALDFELGDQLRMKAVLVCVPGMHILHEIRSMIYIATSFALDHLFSSDIQVLL
ncbi:hypothetical protein JVU11DRAFT_8980 [Chiua virens]|nr:hypothetical protein JVU11DRAFT_8980 [Chiua virens]